MSGAGTTRLEVLALPVPRQVAPGDDLAQLVLDACASAGIRLATGDVVCLASKVVSKAEGALAPLPRAPDAHAARRELAAQQAVRVVAETPGVLVVETRHGFVCANAGVDVSNLGAAGTEDETALLLPDDPDASARTVRSRLRDRADVDVGVLVSDTFGRPWRVGQTDVALGVAGAVALRDERGSRDLDGRALDVTLTAVADELAAAADLVRDKASGTPVVLLRGLDLEGPGSGADLIRPAAEDVFRHGGPTAAEAAVAARRTVRRFADRPVPADLLARAVEAAVTAPAPHHTRPWRFVRLTAQTRTVLLDAMAARWRKDLADDGTAPEVIERRLRASDAVLRTSPELLVPLAVTEGAHTYPDERRHRAERDMFLLAGAAGLQNLQVVLAAHGVGTAWMSSTLFCPETVRDTLDLPADWHPLGMVAVGYPASDVTPRPRPAQDIDDFLLDR